MKAMILAAGLGTRLRPLTHLVSKPMMPLVGRPCLEHALRLLKKYGVEDMAVNLHYLPQQIKDYFGDGSAFGVNIHYSLEKELMGTAGGFKKLQPFFERDTSLIISGDALTDLDLEAFYRFHKEKGCLATLALKRVANPQDYGVVKLEGDYKIQVFQEKPPREEAVSNLANTGIYLFEPEVFDYIEPGVFYDFGSQLFPRFIEEGIPLAGYPMEGYWCDIGNLDIYREAHYDILTRQARVDIPGKRITDNIWLGDRVSIHPQAKIVGPLFIGDNSVIDKGAEIYGPVALEKNTFVGKDSLVKRSILWEGARVEEKAQVIDSILAQGAGTGTGEIWEGEVIMPPGFNFEGRKEG